MAVHDVDDPLQSRARPLNNGSRAAAFVFLFLASLTFMLPTLTAVVTLLEFHRAEDEDVAILSTFLLLVYQPVDGAPLKFIQEYWKVFPALISGAIIAQPRSRKIASVTLMIVMAAVMIFGTFVLQFGNLDDKLHAIATHLSGTGVTRTSAAEAALKEMLNQIRATREIAILLLAGLAPAVLSGRGS